MAELRKKYDEMELRLTASYDRVCEEITEYKDSKLAEVEASLQTTRMEITFTVENSSDEKVYVHYMNVIQSNCYIWILTLIACESDVNGDWL